MEEEREAVVSTLHDICDTIKEKAMELECGGEDMFDEVKCALIAMFALDCDTMCRLC